MARARKHKLIDIITIAICAVISGAEGYNEIADWGRAKRRWLKKFLSLSNGIPSHDTFRRVFSLLDPDEFQRSFAAWVSSVNILLDHRVIAIDGKTLRRSFDPANNKRALHLVSAWACEAKLSLGQVQVDEKSNEITAIPELLRMLELKGAIITLDAMGCQRDIASKIIEKNANYVLALKQNHGDLYDNVQTYFKLESEASHEVITTLEKDHGRIEKRVFAIAKSVDWLPKKNEWQNLQGVVQVTATRATLIGECKSIRYYLTSLPHSNPELIANAIRRHWGVENELHWSLDVTFNEDQSRIRDTNAAQNLALMRKMSLSMLKNAPSHKEKSLKRKRFLASLDDDFLLELIGVTLN
jgi:predicted transposase YbfD/YdcC